MRNLLGVILGALSAPFSYLFYYNLAGLPFAPRSYFLGYIGFWVVGGFLCARLLRRWPALPLGYAGTVLIPLLPRFSHLGAAAAYSGGCGNCYWGAVGSLSAGCLASGMLGSSLYFLASRQANSESARSEIGLTPFSLFSGPSHTTAATHIHRGPEELP